MLNDGDAAEDRTKTESPQARRESQAPSASPYAPSAQQYPPPQLPQTPSYPRPAPSQHPNLTPVQTQYSFSQHPVQSPGPPYASRSYDGYTSQPPYPRPPSISYPHPSQMSKYSHSTSSLSPTPPVTQSPNSMRHQSPVSSRSQPPLSASSQQHSYHHHRSQPSTPLAPPNHYLSRPPPGTIEIQPPYQHQRSYSFASNGHPVASPASQQYGLGGVAESPSVHTRPLPTQRQSSEFSVRSQPRERSESVSPKTKVMPRPQQVPPPSHVQQQQYQPQPIEHQQQRYQTPLRRESTSEMLSLIHISEPTRPY